MLRVTPDFTSGLGFTSQLSTLSGFFVPSLLIFPILPPQCIYLYLSFLFPIPSEKQSFSLVPYFTISIVVKRLVAYKRLNRQYPHIREYISYLSYCGLSYSNYNDYSLLINYFIYLPKHLANKLKVFPLKLRTIQFCNLSQYLFSIVSIVYWKH